MKVCYPGTFDPITNGHLDIISRAAKIYDDVIVLIMVNPRKTCAFTVEERKQMIEDSLADIGSPENVRVVIGSGLTVEFAKSLGCKMILRGIRAVTDYEYELSQATANMMLAEDVETVFMISKPKYSFLSSSICKEIALNGGSLEMIAPVNIIDRINAKMAAFAHDLKEN